MACIKMVVSPTNPKQQAAKPFFVHTEILHMLVSVGSTALAAAVVSEKNVTLHNFITMLV